MMIPQPQKESEDLRICVVFDTNVWCTKRTLLMKTAYSEALLYALQRREARIGLPEIVEDEVFKQVVKTGLRAVNTIRESMEVIKTLTDQGPILLRCSERILKEAVSKRLEELDAFLVRVPLTLEQTRSAVRRVNDEIPPNGPKNQQFKDSVLWEAVLELAKSFRVVLVTYDKGFFEHRDPDRGLAAELKADCEREGQDVSLIHGEALDSFLERLQEGVEEPDKLGVLQAVVEALAHKAGNLAHENTARLSGLPRGSAQFFSTGNASSVVVSFSISYELHSTEDKPTGEPGRLGLSGTCTYDLHTKEVSEVQVTSESIRGPNGEGWVTTTFDAKSHLDDMDIL